MTNEAQAKIQKMVYNFVTDNRAGAAKELKEVLDLKIKSSFRKEYDQLTKSFAEKK
jgi:hypothetical protein